jgi:protein involved in polysaccharide export with SLBB domain
MVRYVVRRLLIILGAALAVLPAGCAEKHITPLADVLREEEASGRVAPAYHLRPGDVIVIDFAAAPELELETPITPSGTITLPMAGEIPAAGRTTDELAALVGEVMSPYLLDPTASILITRLADRFVYVIGEVNRPGRIDMSGGITVSAALAEAGGIDPHGKPSSVMVVRTTGVERALAFKVDVTKILSARDMSQDVALRADDIVYVPKSVIGRVDEFVQLFAAEIAPAQLFYLRGYDMTHLEDKIWRW